MDAATDAGRREDVGHITAGAIMSIIVLSDVMLADIFNYLSTSPKPGKTEGITSVIACMLWGSIESPAVC